MAEHIVRAFYPNGTHKDFGPYLSWNAAMDEKVRRMQMTKNEDVEYYVIRAPKKGKSK